jgi:hypothetical protein
LIESLNGEFPNRLAQMGFGRVYKHGGIAYTAVMSPARVKKGDPAVLRVYFQSFYVGPAVVSVDASHHSALKNKTIARINPELSPLETAMLMIPIETSFKTSSGRKQVDFTIACRPYKGVKNIVDLDSSKVPENVARIVQSAKKVFGGKWLGGGQFKDDGSAMWIEIHYEVLGESASEEKAGVPPKFVTLWPVAKV